MRLPLFIRSSYVRFISLLVRPYLRREIWALIEREERLKRKAALERETGRELVDDDVAERWRHGFFEVKIPCKIGRMIGGRKPHIELRVSEEIMQRLTDTKWEQGMRGKTIDTIFRIPKDLMKVDEEQAAA